MQSYVFVRSVVGISKTTQKPYNFLTISDGIEAFNVGNPQAIDFSKYKEGDKIVLQLSIKSRNQRISADVVTVQK